MYQRVGSHTLLIYPLPFDPQRSKDKIAWERFQQVNSNLVEVEVTEVHFKDGNRPNSEFENPTEFYGLTTIQYQGDIIFRLQREYGEHVQVKYTLYEDYLVTRNQG